MGSADVTSDNRACAGVLEKMVYRYEVCTIVDALSKLLWQVKLCAVSSSKAE